MIPNEQQHPHPPQQQQQQQQEQASPETKTPQQQQQQQRPALRQTKKKIKAAGVLCYSKDKQGNTWFLLGRERPNPKWGKDSNSWSEFGGSLNRDESPEEGAAREFFEESMGVIYGHQQWMERELKENRYLLTLDSSTPSGKGYRSFVKYIPFADYPSKFARYRTLAKKQPELLVQLIPECFRGTERSVPEGRSASRPPQVPPAEVRAFRVDPVCMEKTSINWFSAQQLCNTINGFQDPNDPPNPNIRRGFAHDFAYLMQTPWGKAGFRNEEEIFSNSRNLPEMHQVPFEPPPAGCNSSNNNTHHHHHHHGHRYPKRYYHDVNWTNPNGKRRRRRKYRPSQSYNRHHLSAPHNTEWEETVALSPTSPSHHDHRSPSPAILSAC